MGEWIIPKTDWKSSDYYNFGDLDRVESNTEYLVDLMNDYLSKSITIDAVTDRDMESIDDNSSINRVEGNIKILADNFYEPDGWEEPVLDWGRGKNFDWGGANRLEKNLLLMFRLLSLYIQNRKYCGTFSCGEEDLI